MKDVRIKKHTYYFFNDIINIKNFDPNNIKIEVIQKYSYLLHWTCSKIQHMIKDSKYIKINSVNCLYLIINKVNGYFDETNSTAQKMNFPLRISSVNLTKSAENY